jgi:hypothetical protein
LFATKCVRFLLLIYFWCAHFLYWNQAHDLLVASLLPLIIDHGFSTINAKGVFYFLMLLSLPVNHYFLFTTFFPSSSNFVRCRLLVRSRYDSQSNKQLQPGREKWKKIKIKAFRCLIWLPPPFHFHLHFFVSLCLCLFIYLSLSLCCSILNNNLFYFLCVSI